MVRNDPRTGPLGLAGGLLLLVAALAAALRAATPAEAPATAAAAVVQDLYDALTAGMKQGSALDFAGRCNFLAPKVDGDFDMGLMTRIIVGPTWRSLAEADRKQLVDAFSAYSVATYAHEFASDEGVRFVVNPQTSAAAQGGVVVHSQIVPPGGSPPVPIDYLVREENGRPRIIDVFLNGTISQLAARRSEYSSTLREGGASALVAKLKQKTAELAK